MRKKKKEKKPNPRQVNRFRYTTGKRRKKGEASTSEKGPCLVSTENIPRSPVRMFPTQTPAQVAGFTFLPCQDLGEPCQRLFVPGPSEMMICRVQGERGPAARASAIHEPGKQSFMNVSQVPCHGGLVEMCLSEEAGLPLEKRGPQGHQKRSSLYLFSGRISGLENVPPRRGIMKRLKFQPLQAALRQGLRTKQCLSAPSPHLPVLSIRYH